MIPVLLPLIYALWLGGSSCTLSTTPSIGMTPFRYLRATTHFDHPAEWRHIDLILVGEAGVVTTSQLCEDDSCQYLPKTSIHEWKNLDLDPGEYEIRLIASNSLTTCTATTRLEIQQ